ncbi:MAG TPA: HU family DNA-binding protein [Methanothrix sp.]|nr:HU family DNA-binding protein [Methanothrix sp.]HOK07918.1 HU family DNA-binding protein [Syntrophales bacterium]HOL44433.1 HU family DNA-binding protein [Methanothrix sp.]
MNKTDLITELCEKTSANKTTVKEMVNAFLDAVTNSLVRGEEVNITGFGVFKPVTRKGRVGRNPRSGESVTIEDRTVVKFKPGKILKENVAKVNVT